MPALRQNAFNSAALMVFGNPLNQTEVETSCFSTAAASTGLETAGDVVDATTGVGLGVEAAGDGSILGSDFTGVGVNEVLTGAVDPGVTCPMGLMAAEAS